MALRNDKRTNRRITRISVLLVLIMAFAGWWYATSALAILPGRRPGADAGAGGRLTGFLSPPWARMRSNSSSA
ncbi:MAG: hypothetical protein R2838_17960 [Caldilineaceae bacterium]